MRSFIMAPLAAAVLLGGCEKSALAPADEAEGLLSAAVSTDVDGSWSFSRELILSAPEWVAAGVFGVVPEGPITHIRCESQGTMDIEQSGTTFTGSAELVNACRTHGGQVYQSSPGSIMIVDGVIRGRSVQWSFIEDGFLVCPHHAVLMAAGPMLGTGRCVVPGHPQSPVPADPPPGGTSRVTRFTAWRP